jgi:hypothetical protein
MNGDSHFIKDEHQGFIFLIRKKFYLKFFSLITLDENYDSWKNIPNYNYDPMGFAKWVIIAPLKISYHFTIPDCRNPR